MNKPELITFVASDAGMTKKDAEKAILSTLKGIQTALGKGEKVQLVGFGNWEVLGRKARKGQNPKTLEKIDIPAKNKIKFKEGKELKDAIAGLEVRVEDEKGDE